MFPYPFPAESHSAPLYPYHTTPPGLYPPAVAPFPASHHAPSAIEKEGVRTVYVTNLPMDTTQRELTNMFRLSCPGFEACKFGKDRSDAMVKCAFASFVDRAAASRAIQVLNRFKIDPLSQPEMLLRVEFAKTDDRSLTSSHGSSFLTGSHERTFKGSHEGRLKTSNERTFKSSHERTFKSSNGENHSSKLSVPAMDLTPSNSYESYEKHYQQLLDNEGYDDFGYSLNIRSITTTSPQQQQQLPPCATLFVSGFVAATAEDLKPIFEPTAGFVRFAMGKDGRHAFVSYSDIVSSTSAMTTLNGTRAGPLSSPLSITYAKKAVNLTPSGSL